MSSEDHSISLATYVKVLLFLFFMTFITVFVAQFDLGVLNTPVAMLIASVKAVFVLAYFMHLIHDEVMNRSVVLVGVFFLVLLFIISYADIITRVQQFSTL